MNASNTPPSSNDQSDEDLVEQARPGEGIPSQDPDAAAQFPMTPKESEREAKSVFIVGGLVAGIATGAGVGAVVAGPVGAFVGGTAGAVAGAFGGAAAGAVANPKGTDIEDDNSFEPTQPYIKPRP